MPPVGVSDALRVQMATLVNLETLDLTANQITKLEGLKPLVKLVEFWVSCTPLDKFNADAI